LRSSDFERSSSVPACQNGTPCDSVTVACESAFMRTRSSIDVSTGSFSTPMSYRVSLS
jgi:hypothetical protein